MSAIDAMGTPEGRWTGRWFEWTCRVCGAVMTSREAPRYPYEACCLGCRAQEELTDASTRVHQMKKALREAQEENRRLLVAGESQAIVLETRAREIEALTIEIGQLRDKLAERAA